MFYQISAISQGKRVVIKAQAQSAELASLQAKAQGLTVLTVRPASGLSLVLSGRNDRFPLALFCKDLVALLKSGLSLPESISALAEKEARSSVRSVLQGVLRALESGESLSFAFSRFPAAFPGLLVATVKASERTGGLVTAIEEFSAYLEKLETVRAKVKAASVYPAIVLALGVLVTLFLLGFVTPRFAALYAENLSSLPWASRLLMEFGLIVERYPLQLLFGVLACLAVLLGLGVSPAVGNRFSRAIWASPVLGPQIRVHHLARYYRSVGMLLAAGIALPKALEMAADLLHPELQRRAAQAKSQVMAGASLSKAMEVAGLSTAVALRMMRVGEKSGRMAEMLQAAADFHDQESARFLESFTRLFEPLLMVLVGLVIGLIVILLYIPIFDLAGNIQ